MIWPASDFWSAIFLVVDVIVLVLDVREAERIACLDVVWTWMKIGRREKLRRDMV